MLVTNIIAVDIPDAWFQCVSKVIDVGFKYEIQYGSYVGETRLEFDYITITIAHPYKEPYDLMLPQISAHLNIPNPVANGYIEQYMPYLMTDHIEDGEQYTYGSRINETLILEDKIAAVWHGGQVKYWIDALKKTPNTNQAILQVAQPTDCLLDDPPCLRHIDMRVRDDVLIFYPYFRSWDLWGGMPANLAGIAVLQKYMADEIGVKSGSMVASSKSLHIYGYAEEVARIRVGKGNCS